MKQASVGFHCPECVRSSGQKVYRARDMAAVPVLTRVVMGVCIVAFIAQGGSARSSGIGDLDPTGRGLLWGPAVADGEYWRILTSGFLHADLLHIAFNMYALYLFGPYVERAVGRTSATLCYLGGLVGGSLAVLLFDFSVPTLGASAAVLGMAGALASILWTRGVSIAKTGLGGIFLLNLALPLLVPNISFWGHFGGIAGGALMGLIVSWLPERSGVPLGQAQAAAGLAVVALFAAAVVAASMGGL